MRRRESDNGSFSISQHGRAVEVGPWQMPLSNQHDASIGEKIAGARRPVTELSHLHQTRQPPVIQLEGADSSSIDLCSRAL